MNLRSSRLQLRPRGAADILDLAAPFCVRGWRVLLPLSALVLLPAAAACWLAHAGLHWRWPAVWTLAVVLSGLCQAPFTIAYGELLFRAPRDVRLRPICRRALARSPSFGVVYVVTRLVNILASSMMVLAPFTISLLFVAQEAVLLEGAGPFSALARSGRAVRGQGVAAFGIAVGLALLPVAGLFAGEVTGQALVGSVLQLGEPFGTLFQLGGTPFALIGFFSTLPLVAAARFLKYIDLRTRKEGWDIQLRFMAITRAATETAGTPAPRAGGEEAA